MPSPTTLSDRVQKFKAATDPTRVGTRYGKAKELAVARYIDATGYIVTVRDWAINILHKHGVPAGLFGAYIAFAEKLASYSRSHTGETLKKIIDGLKAYFVAKGCDPVILDEIARLVS